VVTRARVLNPQVFLELLCYAVFSVLTFYLMYSGKYLTYVTPRMAPYLYFTAVVMLLWAFTGVFRLFRPGNRVRVAHCFVPVIPILLILLPHSPLSAADLSYNYAGGGSFSGSAAKPAAAVSSPQNASPPEAGADYGAAQSSPGAGLPEPPVSNAAPFDASDDDDFEDVYVPETDASDKPVIEVGDDEFYSWLDELYMNLDMYVGRRIAMTGFVFKDPEVLGADEFVPARLGMTCCVADLVPYGLVCKYNGTGELTPDEWVRVVGVIQAGVYEGMEEPQIAVTSIEPAEPVEGYIYPFF
jgi:putative membrane protein